MPISPRIDERTLLLDAALAYAGRGWQVFPLANKSKVPRKDSKGFKEATDSEVMINRWWEQFPDANIGVATGPCSGIWVLDIDGDTGAASLQSIEAEIGPLPETLEQVTGGGGRQLIFRWPAGIHAIKNKQNLKPGIDVRGEGGYIVAPPSIHPSGTAYTWPYEWSAEIADAPIELIQMVSPPPRPVAPWERTVQPQQPQAQSAFNNHTPVTQGSKRTSVIDNAKKYLNECPPAVQGNGGHDALLWATRAMIVGFELDDSTALNLLWSEFNPRCQPPWDRQKKADMRDFERKVEEVKRTPGEKPRGWLLNECGLREGRDVLAQMYAKQSKTNLLAQYMTDQECTPEELEEARANYIPFPVELFPKKMCDFATQLAAAQTVDLSTVALIMLAVAGSSMGNCFRLELKQDWLIPPTLWVGILGDSGSNKTGPLRLLTEPLNDIPPIEKLEQPMLNPQGRMVIGDATLEAILVRLAATPRGLLNYRNELTGWANTFDAYKKNGGGDQQAWLEFWDAAGYQLDRKTNDEQFFIPSASVSVLGGTQPTELAKSFDPDKIASGLAPRMLIACPPKMKVRWTDAVVAKELREEWGKVVTWLRTRPFAALDPNNQRFQPHILQFSPEAKDKYVEYFDNLCRQSEKEDNSYANAFMVKARVMGARLTLIHRGLALATEGGNIDDPIPAESVTAGTAWGNWCLNEQLGLYGYSKGVRDTAKIAELADKIRKRGNAITPRDLSRFYRTQYSNTAEAKKALHALVAQGLGAWDEKQTRVTLI